MNESGFRRRDVVPRFGWPKLLRVEKLQRFRWWVRSENMAAKELEVCALEDREEFWVEHLSQFGSSLHLFGNRGHWLLALDFDLGAFLLAKEGPDLHFYQRHREDPIINFLRLQDLNALLKQLVERWELLEVAHFFNLVAEVHRVVFLLVWTAP